MPAQTLKAAKAAYAKRGRPTLSTREQKQLNRSVELEERAKKSRDQAKRRADAIAKRQVEERRQKAMEDEASRLATQRRCDRFGFKESQTHLGAFLGVKRVGKDQEEEEEEFGEAVDDEALLDALEMPAAEGPAGSVVDASEMFRMPVLPALHVVEVGPRAVPLAPSPQLDVNDVWDDYDLGSSTQIARELDSEPACKPASERIEAEKRNDSFDAGEFNLTVDEMEELDAPPRPQSRDALDRKLMPPPMLPSKSTKSTSSSALSGTVNSRANVLSIDLELYDTDWLLDDADLIDDPQIWSFPLSSKKPIWPPVQSIQIPKPAMPQTFVSNVSTMVMPTPMQYIRQATGFTLSELEGFMDDDLQLTQAQPG